MLDAELVQLGVSVLTLVGAPLVGVLVRAAKGTHKGCPYDTQRNRQGIWAKRY